MTDQNRPEGLVTKFAPPGTVAAATEGGTEGQIKGYGSLFNVVDSDGDIMVPGCFDKSLAQHKAQGTMPVMFFAHKSWNLPIGVWQSATVDEKGLLLTGQLALKVGSAAELYELMKIGALSGLSLGFWIRRYEMILEPTTKRPVGRKIFEADLVECSPVVFPAMRQARISEVKSEGAGLEAPPPEPGPPGIDPIRQPRLLKAMADLQDLKAKTA
jgi:HK97 family phage prohead protease